MTNEVTAEDKARALEIVTDLKSKLAEVSAQIQHIQKKVDSGEISTAKGVSFLEVKQQLLLSYNINLTHLLLRKTSGESIDGDPCIARLVETRTVLEKMRPIDQKLKYQVDKLIKTAATGSIGENDPLRYKPNPDNLVSKLDGESGSESDEEKAESGGSKVYRPPKLAAVHYDGDETEQEKLARQEEKKRKRMKSSAIMKDLQKEYYDGPEEIRDTADLHRRREDKAGKEREEYEMNYFVRMQLTKKEMNASKKLRTMGSLNSITHFGDFGAITGEGEDGTDEPRQKKRKIKLKGKKKRAAGKKFRKK